MVSNSVNKTSGVIIHHVRTYSPTENYSAGWFHYDSPEIGSVLI